MIEAITSGLVLAALSGATFVAYNHPGAYRSIAYRVGWPLLIIFVVAFFYQIFGAWAIVQAQQRLPDPSVRKILEECKEAIWKQGGVVELGALVIGVFGVFFSWVSKLRNKNSAN
jgi:hypothetical protein